MAVETVVLSATTVAKETAAGKRSNTKKTQGVPTGAPFLFALWGLLCARLALEPEAKIAFLPKIISAITPYRQTFLIGINIDYKVAGV